MRIGIDLGGTKIEAVLMQEDGLIVQRQRVPTPKGDYSATLQAVVDLVRMFEAQVGCSCSVGMGTPGAISPATGLHKNSSNVGLNGKRFQQDIERRLERSVPMANDANCFALSEATDGAGAGANVVFGVIVGTGCGGGVVVHGRVLHGSNAIAGEWGHNPLPWPREEELPGASCYCGQEGCIETWISGTGLARDHLAVTSMALSGEQIVAQASAGDVVCEATLRRYEDRMARSLAQIINVLDPEVIVLGGGLSKVSRLYDNVPKLWGKYVFSDQVNTRLLPPVHGDSSGVRGAAWLV
ncbi:MAG: ROK family protein [Gammaproteobacteria bacterium]|nr:ROK family protein [Gammaproteobacteria bacterium]